MTLVKAISSLSSTRQGATESDDKFLERYKSCVATIELAGGKNIFCSTELMQKLNDIPDEHEIKSEE